MMNIIDAVLNLIQNPLTGVVSHYSGNNRANNAGDALEEYVKDLFAGTFGWQKTQCPAQHSAVFSYLGNKTNPPDAMLRGGDAIEVKKIEKDNAALALNSSYPKAKLFSDSPMITKACREAEQWSEKDIIYVTGVVRDNNIKHLSMVYGEDYCASEECYIRIKNTVKEGVESINGVEFAHTKELARVNRIDPLGVTYLRVRGMWGIENPWTVFDYVYQRDLSQKFTFMAIINEDKWNSFNNTGKLSGIQNKNLSVTDIKIKNPDNPAQLKNAKLITFYQ